MKQNLTHEDLQAMSSPEYAKAIDALKSEQAVIQSIATAIKLGKGKIGDESVSVETLQNELSAGNTDIMQSVKIASKDVFGGISKKTKILEEISQDYNVTGDNYPGNIDLTLLLDNYIGFKTMEAGVGRIIPGLLSRHNYRRATANVRPSKPSDSITGFTPNPNNSGVPAESQKVFNGRVQEFNYAITPSTLLATFREFVGRKNPNNLSLLGTSLDTTLLGEFLKLHADSRNSLFEYQFWQGVASYNLGGGFTQATPTTPTQVGAPNYFYPNGGDGDGTSGNNPTTDLWGTDGIIIKLLDNARAVSGNTNFDATGKVNVVAPGTNFTTANISQFMFQLYNQIPVNMWQARGKKGGYVVEIVVSPQTERFIQGWLGQNGNALIGGQFFFNEVKDIFVDRKRHVLPGVPNNTIFATRMDQSVQTNVVCGVSMPFYGDNESASIQVAYPDSDTFRSQVLIRERLTMVPDVVFPKNSALITSYTLPAAVQTVPVFNPSATPFFPYGS